MCDSGSHARPLYLLQLDSTENIPKVCVCFSVYVGIRYLDGAGSSHGETGLSFRLAFVD